MSTNHTTHYQLSQWEKSDQVLMEDFNADNAKLDEALKAEADARAAADAAINAALSKRGNCQFYSYSYTGDGQYGTDFCKVLQFPWPPDLVIVMDHFGTPVLLTRGMTYGKLIGSSVTDNVHAAWSGNTVQVTTNNYWSAYGVLNQEDYKYFVFAFRALS